MNLNPGSPRALEWGRLVQAAGPEMRSSSQPWRLYQIDPIMRGDRLRLIPAVSGPLVYAVLEFDGWRYVGQTQQPLAQRLRSHLRDLDRAIRWNVVMAIQLVPDASAKRVDELERLGRDLLTPRTGSRWPASRS